MLVEVFAGLLLLFSIGGNILQFFLVRRLRSDLDASERFIESGASLAQYRAWRNGPPE
jgi:hypothetical protein